MYKGILFVALLFGGQFAAAQASEDVITCMVNVDVGSAMRPVNLLVTRPEGMAEGYWSVVQRDEDKHLTLLLQSSRRTTVAGIVEEGPFNYSPNKGIVGLSVYRKGSGLTLKYQLSSEGSSFGGEIGFPTNGIAQVSFSGKSVEKFWGIPMQRLNLSCELQNVTPPR